MRAETQKWLETLCMQTITYKCLWQFIRTLISFSIALTSFLQSWQTSLLPVYPAENGHLITEDLTRFVSKTLSFCVTAEVHCEDSFHAQWVCQIQHMLCPWKTLQLIDQLAKAHAVFGIMQNYKENSSKELTSHLTNCGGLLLWIIKVSCTQCSPNTT